MGHKLYLKSIDGKEMMPVDLLSRLDRDIQVPDLDICYTAPKNFKFRFKQKSKLKMAIYNYESDKLPAVWKTCINHLDYVLPSSNFSKEIFVNGGWPDKKCIVIPHGINLNDFDNKDVYKLNTNKSFKFLNISIPHHRKNIDLLLTAYYDEFSKEDDVCLVLKTKFLGENHKYYSFEVNVKKLIHDVQSKFSNRNDLPQVEIISNRIDNIIPLYNACDALVSATSSEGFGLPLLEALAAGLLVIAPNCSGQLDFLNKNNSLLIDVKKIAATNKYQYWSQTEGASTFLPEIDDLKVKMRTAYDNKDKLISQHSEERKFIINKFTWENAAKKILELV